MEHKKSWLSSVFSPLVNLFDNIKDDINRTLQINGFGDDSFCTDYMLRHAIYESDDISTPEKLEKAVSDYLEREGINDISLEQIMKYANTMGADYIEHLDTIEDHLEPTDEEKQRKADADAAYEAEMNRWEELNQAVGGDMFTNKEKLAAMRRADAATEHLSWDGFRAKAIEEINNLPSNELSPV